MENKQLEELLNISIRKKMACESGPDDISECLSNETIQSLYDGQLDITQRDTALDHLSQCLYCCDDLKMYADLVSQ